MMFTSLSVSGWHRAPLCLFVYYAVADVYCYKPLQRRVQRPTSDQGQEWAGPDSHQTNRPQVSCKLVSRAQLGWVTFWLNHSSVWIQHNFKLTGPSVQTYKTLTTVLSYLMLPHRLTVSTHTDKSQLWQSEEPWINQLFSRCFHHLLVAVCTTKHKVQLMGM